MQFCLDIKGDFACFTRPEFRSEPVSYDVITPSAAAGVFGSIFVKKDFFYWQINKIEILNPIKWRRIRINRLKKAPSSIKYIEDLRTQKHHLLLQDVNYRVFAEVILKTESKELYTKYCEQFKRRASKGQCFQQPVLGCREFPCYFRLIESFDNETKFPINDSQDLSWMLHHIDPDTKTPKFFRAKMINGTITVPSIKDIKNDY